MSDNTKIAALVCYALAAIFTFGHAYVSLYEEQLPKFEAIRAQGKVAFGSPEEGAGYGAFLCAIGWPLYVSVQIAKGMR